MNTYQRHRFRLGAPHPMSYVLDLWLASISIATPWPVAVNAVIMVAVHKQ